MDKLPGGLQPGGLAGLILAGGQARRMQTPPGQAADACVPVDKGLLQLDGLPLVARAHQFLQQWANPVLISANQNAAAYVAYAPVLADNPVYGAQAGPLAGIASTLDAVETIDWLLVVPVDVPFLPPDLLVRLAEEARLAPSPLAFAATPRGDHPLCLLLHRSTLPGLRQYVLQGGRRVMGWLGPAGARRVRFPEANGWFLNINTLADWHEAQRLAAGKSA